MNDVKILTRLANLIGRTPCKSMNHPPIPFPHVEICVFCTPADAARILPRDWVEVNFFSLEYALWQLLSCPMRRSGHESHTMSPRRIGALLSLKTRQTRRWWEKRLSLPNPGLLSGGSSSPLSAVMFRRLRRSIMTL